MSGRREECEAALAELVEADSVQGAILVSRDGLPVLQSWNNAANVDTLSAMGAALMGAAETSLFEFGRKEADTVLVVANDMRLAVLGVDSELLLMVSLDRSRPIEEFDEALHNALARVRGILQEA